MLQTCLHCTHFDEETEGCAKANGLRPPAETIVFGCELFTDCDQVAPVAKAAPPKPKPHPALRIMSFDDIDDDIPF